MKRGTRIPALAASTFLSATLVWVVARNGGANADGDEPGAARIATRSGEVVMGQLALDAVTIRTKYGPLKVPLGEIGSIEFARYLTDDDRADVSSDLETLRRSEDSETEQAARQRLVSRGSLVIDLLRAAHAEGEEAFNQALGEIIEEIIDREPERRPTDDRIVARRFTITGRVELDHLDVRCSFGTIAIARLDLDRVTLDTGVGRQRADRFLLFKSWTDASGEYNNVAEILRSRARLRLVEFEGQSAGDLRRALAKHSVIVLPEFENGDDALVNLAQTAASSLRRFVREGGVVISCGGGHNNQFLTASGLLPCDGSSDSSPATIVKRHPILKGVSQSIPSANATFPINVQAGRKIRPLATSANGGVLVGVSEQGAGAVVYCGWDYYASEEPHQRVLANAVLWAAGRLGGGR